MEREVSELINIFPNLSRQVIKDALKNAQALLSVDASNDLLSAAINILLSGFFQEMAIDSKF